MMFSGGPVWFMNAAFMQIDVRQAETALLFSAESQNAERRGREDGGPRLVVDLIILGLKPTEVALVAPAIDFGVAVQNLAPEARSGQADPILVTRHRGKIHDDEDAVGQLFVLPDKGEHAVFVVRTIHPEKAFHVVITFPEAGLRAVEFVEILDEPLQAPMERTLS